jgi:hypothetical protein
MSVAGVASFFRDYFDPTDYLGHLRLLLVALVGGMATLLGLFLLSMTPASQADRLSSDGRQTAFIETRELIALVAQCDDVGARGDDEQRNRIQARCNAWRDAVLSRQPK